MKNNQPNAEALRRLIERVRREQMVKKGPTWEELGQRLQGFSPEQKLKDKRDQSPSVPTD